VDVFSSRAGLGGDARMQAEASLPLLSKADAAPLDASENEITSSVTTSTTLSRSSEEAQAAVGEVPVRAAASSNGEAASSNGEAGFAVGGVPVRAAASSNGEAASSNGEAGFACGSLAHQEPGFRVWTNAQVGVVWDICMFEGLVSVLMADSSGSILV